MHESEGVEPMEYEILENQEPILFPSNNPQFSIPETSENLFLNLRDMEMSLREEEGTLSRLQEYKEELQDQKLNRMEEVKRALQDENIIQALIRIQNRIRDEERNEAIQVKYILPDKLQNFEIKKNSSNLKFIKNVYEPQFDLIKNENIVFVKHLRNIRVNGTCYVWKEEIKGIRKSQYEIC